MHQNPLKNAQNTLSKKKYWICGGKDNHFVKNYACFSSCNPQHGHLSLHEVSFRSR